LDPCSVAAYVALNCTVIPKVEIYVGESGRAEDFEISGDISDATKLKAENFPICVSSSKVRYRHGY
jgi:exosome complex RNA-binding protein Rrp42 (RNase PH superfamily)